MITVDWGTKVINIPQSYLTLVGGSIYTLDTNVLRLDLKALEDDETGMSYPDTHRHNTVVTLSGVDYARTFEIINGYTVTFEDGEYRVSLIGTNNNVADVTNINNVSLISNNSAGLTDVEVQRELSFLEAVHIDTVNGISGTNYPIGTSAEPVNNLADAVTIAEKYGFKRIDIRSNLVIDRSLNFYSFYSNIPTNAVVLTGTDISNCTFERLTITGDVGGSTMLTNQCSIGNLLNTGGLINEGFLAGSIHIATGDVLTMTRCFSGLPGNNAPIIDMNAGNDTQLNLRDYSGGLNLQNCDTPNSIATLEYVAGKCNLESTCTDGLISVRGLPKSAIGDDSNGTEVNIDSSIDGATEISNAVSEKIAQEHGLGPYNRGGGGYIGITAKEVNDLLKENSKGYASKENLQSLYEEILKWKKEIPKQSENTELIEKLGESVKNIEKYVNSNIIEKKERKELLGGLQKVVKDVKEHIKEEEKIKRFLGKELKELFNNK